jgi:hypothetical protein
MTDTKRPQITGRVNGSLRDRIAAVLKSHWPAPWFGGDRQHQQVTRLADTLIHELGLRQETIEDWHGRTTHSE